MQENKDFENNNGFVIKADFLNDNSAEAISENAQNENNEPKKQKKDKKPRKKLNPVVKNIIWISLIIVISFGLAVSVIYTVADFMGLGFGRGENCSINIEKGSSATKITEQLEESGAIKIPFLFRAYCKLKGYDSQFKYGFYHFNTESGYEAIAQMLITEGAKAESIKVTIPEGVGINDYIKNVDGEDVTVSGIATILEKAGVCTKSDLLIALDNVDFKSDLLKCANVGKAYYSLEGYLFPETYEFYKLEDTAYAAELVVEKMIDEAERRITEPMFDRARELGYDMNEILTIASIVQMEAGNNFAKMPDVAAVFYNRLENENFKTLGSSPTCYYGNSFKNDTGKYNTYNIEGLPPGPLCSPGIDAIKAALYPTENSSYYYFVTDKKGNFYFHKTLEEQEKTIAELKKGNNWIYEYFD